MFSGSFVTQFEAAVVAEPRQRAFDNIPRLAQSAPMRTSARRQQAGDHQANEQLDDPHKAISSVALHGLWLGVLFSVLVGQMRKLLEHRLDHFLITLIRGAGLDHKRDAVGVTNNVAFTAIFSKAMQL